MPPRGNMQLQLGDRGSQRGSIFCFTKVEEKLKNKKLLHRESLQQAVGEDGVEQEERQRTNRSFHFRFKKSLRFPQL
ncbi:unnamed protein product [Tetraodon nigroviridis]|uniref:(spotted green pufferfish) hypothetical protein n=1 Tax=Tetraodon nigroviridis TaxID=99883 RepID=Q4RT83_TETNG|nr:unnamed protein product [Tetraodon nigroviridis]